MRIIPQVDLVDEMNVVAPKTTLVEEVASSETVMAQTKCHIMDAAPDSGTIGS